MVEACISVMLARVPTSTAYKDSRSKSTATIRYCESLEPLLFVTDIEGVCLSLPGFLLAVIFLLSVLVVSSLLCTYFWFKLQKGRKSLEPTRTVHLETFPISKA
jgi:hypothetical protein